MCTLLILGAPLFLKLVQVILKVVLFIFNVVQVILKVVHVGIYNIPTG